MYDIEQIKELFKLVSSLDKDWTGNNNSRVNLVRFLTKNQEFLPDDYVEAAYACVAEYDEAKLHFLRHLLINEILVDENKEKRKYFVYKHTAPNGKVYIGITCCDDVELRWVGGWGYRKNISFYEDIQKYGWDNITHEVLYKNLSPDEARRIEIKLIGDYRSANPQYGYNIDEGGRISPLPYVWTTWAYDVYYQFRAKRRPFKVIVDVKDLKRFEKHVAKYDGEIIECTHLEEISGQCFVIASNPSFKEKQIRETIKSHIENNNSSMQVQYLYGTTEGYPFEFDLNNNTLIVRLYAIDKRDYKFDVIMSDLLDILEP